MPLQRNFKDLSSDYRTALEAGVGRSPTRVVVRLDTSSRLQVYDLWDMRPRLLHGGVPLLVEEGLLSMDDAARVAEDLLRDRRSLSAPLHQGVTRVR